MKQQLVSAVVAAVMALGVVAGVEVLRPPHVEHLFTYMAAPSPHAWPTLGKDEKAALTALARTWPKTVKFDIVCNDAGCSELAADLDDVFEDAGLESAIDKAIGPLGYGIGVQVSEFDKPAAETAIAAIDEITSGRLKTSIVSDKSPAGYVTIMIGKRPRG